MLGTTIYRTPLGTFKTWEAAAVACERADFDPCACIVVETLDARFERLAREAFAAGKKAIPCQDAATQLAVEELAGDSGDAKLVIAALTCWHHAWHQANLAAPV